MNFNIGTNNNRELILRCLDKSNLTNSEDFIDTLDTLIYETQLLKMDPLHSSVALVREEIIEFDFQKNEITNYFVIQEHSNITLRSIADIWLSKTLSD